MAAPPNKQFGVTPPISVAPPTQKEIEATAALKEELIKAGSYESPEDSAKREMVLARVAALVKKFVHKVMVSRGHTDAAARNAGGKIFTFGSYRLGVHGPGADIDTLCVVPKHVDREDFFTYFEPMLKELDGATEVAGVPDAYVPIITANISGIAIDFLCARLALPAIPDDLELKDDNLLKNLDERCVRSLGGSRVTDQILRLVPNVEVFRLALRCIKLWAQRRAIYSNINGFLGGVAWAMLVARICQLYPNAAAGAIVSRFFVILYQWEWPAPVILTKIEDGPLQVRVWNPKLYPSDRAHRMPIITPAYPSMCSTHNVGASQLTVLTQEFKRGHEIVERVLFGKASWSELWTKHDFFHRYTNYLQVVASATEQEAALKWSGKVESQVRQLVAKLEFVEGITLAHPFVKGIEHTFYCSSSDEMDAVTLGHISPTVAKQTLEDLQNFEDPRTVYTTSFYVGLGLKPKQHPPVPGGRKLDISYPTTEFVKQLKQWESFDSECMAVVVAHVKHSSLPDDVFGPEGRPAPTTKSLKRTKSKKHIDDEEGPNKKRRSEQTLVGAGASQVDLSIPPAPLGAEQKAQQQRETIPSQTPQLSRQDSATFSAEELAQLHAITDRLAREAAAYTAERNGLAHGHGNANGMGVTAAASITDANLAAAATVLEATSIKSPTPEGFPPSSSKARAS